MMSSFISNEYLAVLITLSVLLIAYYSQMNQSNVSHHYNIPDPDCTGVFNLCTDSDKERLGKQAIQYLHQQIDDDKDGLIQMTESSDFIQHKLETENDSKRYQQFQNTSLHITFDDLWNQWTKNAVYNWTNDDVINWLVNEVHLVQYADNFRRNQIDGRMIPRLAANERHYISMIMHIRDIRDKQRLIIKSTDAVLFGPPIRSTNHLKHVLLISLLIISLFGCVYGFYRHYQIQDNMSLMLKEFDILQKVENDLLPTSRKMLIKDKIHVGKQLIHKWLIDIQQSKEEANRFRLRRDSTIDHNKQLSLALQEIEQLKNAIDQAEEHARQQSKQVPNELIDLLKRTYQIEETSFDLKRKLAENAFLSAKEHVNKMSKMRKGFLGAVRIAHMNYMENAGELINTAKERLLKLQNEHEEREQRWNRIACLLNRDDLINSSKANQ